MSLKEIQILVLLPIASKQRKLFFGSTNDVFFCFSFLLYLLFLFLISNDCISCFTTEILEGFDVLRTSGLGETLRKYGCLTQAINQYYKCMDNKRSNTRLCPRFNEFIRKCEDLDKMTVSDVFATQLMQVGIFTSKLEYFKFPCK